MRSFLSFLTRSNILGLGVGVVIGSATAELVRAVVDDIFMPVIGLLLPGGSWRAAVVWLGFIEFPVGDLIGAVLDFVLIVLALYLILRFILHTTEEDLTEL